MISINVFGTALFSKKFGVFKELKREGVSRKDVEKLEELCIPNPIILKAYNNTPQKFIFTTDLNVKNEDLVRILKLKGFKTPRAFSCLSLETEERDKKFFRKIKLRVKEDVTLHYGCDYERDILKIKELGIKTVFNPDIEDLNLGFKSIKDSRLKSYLTMAVLKKELDLMELKDFMLFSRLMLPVLVSFCQWIKNKKYGKLCFVGREMAFPYLIYTTLMGCKSDFINIEGNFSREDLNKITLSHNFITYDQIKEVSTLSLFGYGSKAFLRPFERSHLLKYFLFGPERAKDSKSSDLISSPSYYKIDFLGNYSKLIVLNESEEILEETFNPGDLQELLEIACQQPYFITFCNDKIFDQDGVRRSLINFDPDAIKNGNLEECYQKSLDKKLFMELLKKDLELSYLKKYLT